MQAESTSPKQSSDESNKKKYLATAVASMPSVASLCKADSDLNGHSGWSSSLLLVSVIYRIE